MGARCTTHAQLLRLAFVVSFRSAKMMDDGVDSRLCKRGVSTKVLSCGIANQSTCARLIKRANGLGLECG